MSKLTHWLGKFHPMTVHFPIALIMTAAVAELISVLSAKQHLFRFVARFCLWLGTLGALGSATLGWFLAGSLWGDPTWIQTTHQWFGTGTAAFSILVLILCELNERKDSVVVQRSYWASLVLGVVLVGTTGFFGGAMIYGIDHYRWPSATSDPANNVNAASQESTVAATVEMTDQMTFEPDQLTIKSGQAVRWKGIGMYEQTVTADPEKAKDPDHVRLPEGAQPFDSGQVPPGGTFTHTFEIPGSYRYFCIPHESAGMIGEIQVTKRKP